jgi:micrococcal nuclease
MIVLPNSGIVYGPYAAELVRAKDGDTALLYIRTWPSTRVLISVREFGIDTPETRTRNKKEKELGIAATRTAEEFLKAGIVSVDNVVYGKYAGRVLGSIYVDGDSLGEYMLAQGLAREYYGGKRKPWFPMEESSND